MRHLILSMLVLLLSGTTVFAQQKEAMSGKWEYSAPEAPYGYHKGAVEFKSVKGKLEAVIHVQGSSVAIKKIQKKDGLYNCSATIDGSYVEIVFNPKGKKLSAKATADYTEFEVSFKRPEK